MELVFDQVTKQFKNKLAVNHVSLSLKEGIYGLLGANGAGKTTLMRIMCGVLKPDSGKGCFNGISVQEEAFRDVLGYLPQQFGHYPDFSAMDFLMYLAALKGLPKRQAKEKSLELLELAGLSSVAKKKIKTFSGGMKQRLGIAQSLLNNPKVLVMDEPTAGLDPKERVKFRNLISKLGDGRIVLLSTHIVSDVEYIADVVLIMKDGMIIHNGSLDEIIKAIEGKVWECIVDGQTAEKLMANFPSINVRKEQNGTFLRLVCSQKPVEGAVNVKASLEDLYLYFCDK